MSIGQEEQKFLDQLEEYFHNTVREELGVRLGKLLDDYEAESGDPEFERKRDELAAKMEALYEEYVY